MTFIWIAGIAVLLLYTAVSYWCLHRKVDTAVILRDNIFQSENVSSPFVLGMIRPRIYLPYNMDGQNLNHVVAHEQAHIRRRDHWWKPLGFLLLTVHWFNPLMWLAYGLLCRDIELACDEKVTRGLSREQRADYAGALLAFSVNRTRISACPLAFGEVGVKERVKSVLHYRKPAFWVVVVSVAVCIVVGVCFLTDPVQPVETVEWPALEEIQEGYTMEQAAADGCVVLDGSTLLAGEKSWVDFVNGTAAGRPAVVRIYQAYSDQGDDFYVKELRYDGERYSLQFYDRTGDTNEVFLSQSDYRYLVRSSYGVNNGEAVCDCYFLADSEAVTAQGYFSAMASSLFPPKGGIYYHCDPIYSNVITDTEEYINTYDGVAFADLDGDGQEERCGLGIGPTSGLFTFTLTVYKEDRVVQSIFCTDFYYLSFLQEANGTLRVQGVTQGESPETHLLDIVFDGETVGLTEDGQALEFW